MAFTGYSSYLRQLQMASHNLAANGITSDEEINSKSKSEVLPGKALEHIVMYQAYELIACDCGLGGGAHRVLRFPPPLAIG